MSRKSNEEILEAIEILTKEVEELPTHNIFGDSNADDIGEMKVWCSNLQAALDNKCVHNDDVSVWLEGEWSPVSDCV